MYDSSDSFSPAQPDFVRQIRSHIKNLQTELDSRRTAFEASVAPLEAHIRQYQSMLCPCHSLPTEVWGEIFKFVPTLRKFTEEDSFVVNIHPNSSEYPWNISRVCRRWRMICITSPNIWNSVSLTKMDRFTSGTNSILSAVLERAITSPSLHIRLDFTSFSLEYLPTMQEYLPRITHLHVEGKAKEFARLTTILPLSNLRELTVRVFAAWFSFSDNDSDDIENEDEETGSQWDDEPLDCMPILRSFQSCPKLRVLGLEVDMDGMCAEAEPIDHAALTFPWSQLAELTISWPNNGGVLAPLYESCENLEKLSFDGYAYSPASPHHWEAVAQVVLPKLSSLDLQNVPWGMPQSFVCPSLDTLCIGSICYEPDVMDMVSKAGSVRTLVLVFDSPHRATGARGNMAFKLLMPVMAEVEELTIRTMDEDMMDSVARNIHDLAQRTDGKLLLPSLRAFTLHMTHSYNFSEVECRLTRLILTMLTARMVTGLKEVKFSLWDSDVCRNRMGCLPEGMTDGPGLAASALVCGLNELRSKGLKVTLLVNHGEESEYYL